MTLQRRIRQSLAQGLPGTSTLSTPASIKRLTYLTVQDYADPMVLKNGRGCLLLRTQVAGWVNRLCQLAALLAAIAIGIFASGLPADAMVIHESATLGPTGQTTGFDVTNIQFLGSRFSISQMVMVDAIGGHMGGLGPIFGAIVQLSSPTALPTGSPFAPGEAVASTTFSPGSPSSDLLTPLLVTLPPGDYGLVLWQWII